MQRVRIGLMGLAAVFLLVLLAAAFFGLAGSDPGSVAPGDVHAGATRSSATAAPTDPKEPLAELGVAPGGAGDGNTTTTAKTIPPRGH